MTQAVLRLMRSLEERYGFRESDVVSVIFSQTRDVVSGNPAAAVRSVGYGKVPLFCTQEPEYAGSLPRVIRALVTFSTDRERTTPVYLDGAEQLRPDLAAGKE